jgi:hypothetical protein
MKIYPIIPIVDYANTIAVSGDESINKFYNNIRLINKKDEFNGVCFNYALNNYSLGSCEDSIDILLQDYIPIAFEDIQSGDIVSYHKDEEKEDIYTKGSNTVLDEDEKEVLRITANHFGVVVETSPELYNVRIKSKWGWSGVFEGKIFEVCTSYGSKIIFWRKLDKV